MQHPSIYSIVRVWLASLYYSSVADASSPWPRTPGAVTTLLMKKVNNCAGELVSGLLLHVQGHYRLKGER